MNPLDQSGQSLHTGYRGLLAESPFSIPATESKGIKRLQCMAGHKYGQFVASANLVLIYYGHKCDCEAVSSCIVCVCVCLILLVC